MILNPFFICTLGMCELALEFNPFLAFWLPPIAIPDRP